MHAQPLVLDAFAQWLQSVRRLVSACVYSLFSGPVYPPDMFDSAPAKWCRRKLSVGADACGKSISVLASIIIIRLHFRCMSIDTGLSYAITGVFGPSSCKRGRLCVMCDVL